MRNEILARFTVEDLLNPITRESITNRLVNEDIKEAARVVLRTQMTLPEDRLDEIVAKHEQRYVA
jgi:hypothetical protein